MIVELWGCEIDVNFSKHALDRTEERSIITEVALNNIKSAEEQLGEIKVGNTFVIIDTLANITVVGELKSYDNIEIITAVNKGVDFTAKNASDIIIILS